MRVGDLVRLNREFFGGDPSADIGLIIRKLRPQRGNLFLILWNDGEIEPFHEDDLEVVCD